MNNNEKTETNVRTFLVISLLLGLTNGIFRPMAPLFALSLGLTMGDIGLVSAISLGIASAALIVFGRLIDRYGRKPGVLMSLSLYLLSSIVMFVARSLIDYLLGMLLFEMAFDLMRPARGITVIESAPKGKVGTSLGMVFTATGVPLVFSPFIGGVLSERIGYRGAMLISGAFSAIALIIAALFLKETFRTKERGLVFDVRRLMRSLKPEGRSTGLYVIAAIDMIAWSLWAPLLHAHLRDNMGASPTYVGALSSVLNGFWVLTQVPSGKLTDKLGGRIGLVSSELVAAISIIGIVVAPLDLQAVPWAVLGISISLWVPAYNYVIGEMFPQERRGLEYGKISAFRGVISSPFPYVGGLLYEQVGPSSPFLAALPITLFNALLIQMTLKEGQVERTG